MVEQLAQYGLAGLVVAGCGAFAWRLIGLLWALVESRVADTNGNGTATVGAYPSSPLCRVDPSHFEQTRETSKRLREWQGAVDRGEFKCAWNGRDEVRDLLEALKNSAAASERLTAEVANLASEIRTTRNGSKG